MLLGLQLGIIFTNKIKLIKIDLLIKNEKIVKMSIKIEQSPKLPL